MRIIAVSSNLDRIGGIQRYNKTLLRLLNELGQEMESVQLRGGTFFGKLFFSTTIFYAFFIKRPDVMLCTHVHYGPIVRALSRFFRIPYVIILYGIDALRLSEKKQQVIRGATAIIYLFDWTRLNIEAQLPNLGTKLFQLPNSIDGDRYVIRSKPIHLLERHGIPSGSKIILTVARMVRSENGGKGYMRVIQALPAILSRIPNCHYIIIGDGDERSDAIGCAEKLSMTKHVTFAGSVSDEDLVDYFNVSDAYCMPSRGEGFAIVFLEAMACGVPVLAGNYEDADAILLNGQLGITVDPEDIKAIALGTCSLLEGKAGVLKGEALREKTLALYGYEVQKMRVKDFIQYIDTMSSSL